MRTVAILALDDCVPFDLATPCEVFGRARLADGTPAYDVKVCAPSPRVRAGLFQIKTRWGLRTLARADMVIIPGVSHLGTPFPPEALRAVRRAADHGARIASICSGAFVLAATGLLDGLRATTHWLAAAELQRRHPRVQVDPDVLYVDNGQVLTSAGAAAGLDLCLHLVLRDYGAAVAAEAACMSVMPLRRDGGQAQFIRHAAPQNDGALPALQAWLEAHLQEDITLPRMAKRAAMSVRSLNRRFREDAGTTPLQWLLHARVRRAQALLETTQRSIEQIAADAGFGSTAAFRDRFRRVAGVSPQAYRRAFTHAS